MKFVKIGQGDCLQWRPECAGGNDVFWIRFEVDCCVRKAICNGRGMAGRTVDAVGMAIGMTIGQIAGGVMEKSEAVNCSIATGMIASAGSFLHSGLIAGVIGAKTVISGLHRSPFPRPLPDLHQSTSALQLKGMLLSSKGP